MKKQIVRILLWGAVFAVMAVIFSFSSESAAESSETSNGVITVILDAVEPDFSSMSPEVRMDLIEKLSNFVRKCAHFTVYCLLAVLVCTALGTYELTARRRAVGTLIFCAAYAVSDEIHQYFVPGRACRLFDVCVDSAGALCGVAAVLAVSALVRKIKHKSYAKERR